MWVDEFRELSSGIVRVRTWASAAGQLSPTVVLAHGLGGSVLDWVRWTRWLLIGELSASVRLKLGRSP